MTRARGFTMMELLVSLVVSGTVMGAAVWYFRGMSRAVAGTADRMDVMQNLRYAFSTVDRDLRNAGAGTTETQPTLVYLSPTMVVFNADLVSRTAGSATAVNYNPDADPNAITAPTKAQRFTIPTTAVSYPDTTYTTQGAIPSPAETVIFWFAPDTSTARTDDYVLLRQVNGNVPDVVARNLLPYPGRPFFDWLQTDTSGNLFSVASAQLPLRHSIAIHGALSDTGAAARIDSIRAVRVNVYGTNGLTGSRELLRWLVTTVRIPNAGLTKQRSCGDAPFFNQSVSANYQGPADTPRIRLAWSAAVDETGGEKDVEQYVIYRRTVGMAGFGDALQSVPAGQASYTYDDMSVLNDSSYVYGVTALDCTPLESAASVTAAVSVPPRP